MQISLLTVVIMILVLVSAHAELTSLRGGSIRQEPQPGTPSPISNPTSESEPETASPTSNPTTLPIGSGCCSQNFRTCASYGGDSKESCESLGSTIWLENGDLPQQCLEQDSACTDDLNACCPGLTCDGDQWYKQCKFMPNTTKSPTSAPTALLTKPSDSPSSNAPRCPQDVCLNDCHLAYYAAGPDGTGGVPGSGRSECNDDEFAAYPNFCTLLICSVECREECPSIPPPNPQDPLDVCLNDCYLAYYAAGPDGTGGVPGSGRSECNDDEFAAYPNFCTLLTCSVECREEFPPIPPQDPQDVCLDECYSVYVPDVPTVPGNVPGSGRSECNDDEFAAYPNFCTILTCVQECYFQDFD